jgi:hypothetical protein
MRKDIVSIISRDGTAGMVAVDEIIIFSAGGDSSIKYNLVELNVSTRGRIGGAVSLLRGGGGMVFVDTVSTDSVMYTGSELVEQGLRVKNADEFRKKLGSFITAPGAGESGRTMLPSMRNLVLFGIFVSMDNSPLLGSLIANVNASTVAQYMNINTFFAAALDNGNLGGSVAGSLRFQHWAESLRDDPLAAPEVTLHEQDRFHGHFSCFNKEVRRVSVSVTGIAKTAKSNMYTTTVEIQDTTLGARHVIWNAIFTPSVGMLQIPATATWVYPLTLFFFRSPYAQNAVEVVGTVEYLTCGAIFLNATRAGPGRGSGLVLSSNLRNALIQFNSILQTIMEPPEPSIGITLLTDRAPNDHDNY